VYRLIITGIGVLVAALLAMGCGSGGSDGATAQVSKAEFFKQARAICEKTQKKLVAELAASNNNSNTTAVPSRIAQLREKEAEELEALTGSEAVEGEVKPFIATIVKVSHLVAQEGQATTDDPSIQAYNQEADALGLRHC
jgi:hypothetical protein